jgi:hypothetical protein
MSHRVKHHRWINGTLNVFERVFKNFDQAKSYAEKIEGDSIKVYNADGECVHEVAIKPQDTYA